ncbi:MAG TPA: hypothetical protein VGR25_01725 [bacterium]|jgi:hypothetical protein|nr:hypothetical protein [bacterium]
MSERDALIIFAILLGAMLVVGALLPSIAPGLINLLNRTVLKGEKRPNEH